MQVVAEDKRNAELCHRVSVPITKTFFKTVFWSVKPYSQSLVVLEKFSASPSDRSRTYHLAHLRKHPADERFATGANVKEAVPLGADTLHRFFVRGDKCLNENGGKWKSDVYHLLPTYYVYIEIRIKFSTSEFYIFLNSFE